MQHLLYVVPCEGQFRLWSLISETKQVGEEANAIESTWVVLRVTHVAATEEKSLPHLVHVCLADMFSPNCGQGMRVRAQEDASAGACEERVVDNDRGSLQSQGDKL